MTRTTAAELVRQHPAEAHRAKLEVFDWLAEKQDKRVSKNPGGYLVKSIRKSYVPPKGFESKMAREKKQADERERKRQTEEAERRTEAEERDREEAEQLRVSAYLDSLTPEEREVLKPRRLAKANPFSARQYRRSQGDAKSEARYLKLIVGAHVSEILADRGSAREQRAPWLLTSQGRVESPALRRGKEDLVLSIVSRENGKNLVILGESPLPCPGPPRRITAAGGPCHTHNPHALNSRRVGIGVRGYRESLPLPIVSGDLTGGLCPPVKDNNPSDGFGEGLDHDCVLCGTPHCRRRGELRGKFYVENDRGLHGLPHWRNGGFGVRRGAGVAMVMLQSKDRETCQGRLAGFFVFGSESALC